MRIASSLSLVFLALFAAPALAAPQSLSATGGGVTATISGDAQERDEEAGILRRVKDLVVTIDSPAPRFRAPLPLCTPDCGQSDDFMSASITLRDLNGDRAPEVLVDRFRDGDVCCSLSTTVLEFNRGVWRSLRPVQFGSFVTLKDADGDGDPDLVGDDPRFFTRFAQRVFGVFLPLRVHRYEGDGTFVDITMALRNDLRKQRAQFIDDARGGPTGVTRASLPAIAALDHLLGEHRRANQRFTAAVKGKRITAKLARRMKAFLKRSGYCAGCAAPAAIDAKLP